MASRVRTRGHGEGAGQVVFLEQLLHAQGHGVGLSRDVAGDDVDRAELAHRARVAEDDPVGQAPLDVGQGDAPEHLPAAGPEADGGRLLVGADGLHDRDQLAGHEGEGHEGGGEDEARRGEDDLEALVVRPDVEGELDGQQRPRTRPPPPMRARLPDRFQIGARLRAARPEEEEGADEDVPPPPAT